MHVLLGFLTMGVIAFLLWKLLARQEAGDPEFERRLQADERRARANRQADARRAAGMQPTDDRTPDGTPPDSSS